MNEARLLNAGKAGEQFVFLFIGRDGSTISLSFSEQELKRVHASTARLVESAAAREKERAAVGE